MRGGRKNGCHKTQVLLYFIIVTTIVKWQYMEMQIIRTCSRQEKKEKKLLKLNINLYQLSINFIFKNSKVFIFQIFS